MKPYLTIITILATLLIGCNTISEKNLIGKWQATTINSSQEKQNIDLSRIQLEFSPNGIYQYHSTLDYQEAGYYELDDSKLYTVDTLNEGSTEKTVKITQLSKESLTIEMIENNNPITLKLKKVQ